MLNSSAIRCRMPVVIRHYRWRHCADTDPGDYAMRSAVIAATLTVATLVLIFAANLGLAQQVSAQQVLAQQRVAQQGLPQLTPPPPAPIKPYQAVAVTPPVPFNDPGFIALRKQLADAATHKDRAALAKLVVAQSFFWIQDKNLADPHKSGIDNLAKAINLDAQDGSGWEIILGDANEPSAAEIPQQKGVYCAPADPAIDPAAFEALGKATGTDPSEWGYPIKDGVEVHASAAPNAPLVEKLGLNLVRVLPDTAPPTDPNAPLFLHVATPSGKTGFADAQFISPLGGDQMCYVKDASGWKIAGYLGGASQ
jgi:hypothetical protein